MSRLLFILFLFISFSSIAQLNFNHVPQVMTKKYAGSYCYGKDMEKERIGTVFVYPETDSTILFFFELTNGAPNYNVGIMYERVKIEGDSGVLYSMRWADTLGCKLSFKFEGDRLNVKTLDSCNECGFEGDVYADGSYKKYIKIVPDYFVDRREKKIFFKWIKPEDYYQE